jgi:hypothetical protein
MTILSGSNAGSNDRSNASLVSGSSGGTATW